MQGMSRTGVAASGAEYLWERVNDRLTTPVGSRVMRREYGIALEIMDQPLNAETVVDLFAAIASALDPEPDFVLRRISLVKADGDGSAEIFVDGYQLIDGKRVPRRLEGLIL